MNNKILLIVSFLFISFSQNIFCEPTRVDTLLNYLNDKGKSSHVMIFAHRGDWRNSTENSIKSFQDCIDAKLDGIEVDVQMTKDSVLIAMHDDTIDRTTTGKGKVSDLTFEEIRNENLISPIGVVTRQKVPSLEEVFILAKDRILIQVDKWKPYLKEVIQLAQQHGCERQLIFRTTDKSEVTKEKYNDLINNIILMPVLVCKGKNDNEKLDDFLNNYTSSVISFSFTKDSYEVLERINAVKESGYRIWLNSLWDTFNAGHDDELAGSDPDAAYGWLLHKGADIIFTDHPLQLKRYLESVGKRNF